VVDDVPVGAGSLSFVDVLGPDLPADQGDADEAAGCTNSAADDASQSTSMTVRADALVRIEQGEGGQIGGRHSQTSGTTSAAKRSAFVTISAPDSAANANAKWSTLSSANLRTSAAIWSGEPRMA
jgi:hypothetical protein